MKKVILILLFVFLSFNVYAESKDIDEICGNASEMAEAIMKARQNNAPMRKIMNSAPENKLIKIMIKDAYSQPRMNVEENQQDMITDFGNKYYKQCLKIYEE